MPKCRKTYKDMDKYNDYVNRNRKANYQKGNFSDGTARPYTLDEMELILEHSMSDRELAKLLKRSVQSIQIKRCRLKKKEAIYES